MKNKTQNILKKYLFFALGMLAAAILPTMAFAVTPPSTSALIGYNPFEVPSTDLSVAFLSQIFGNIPGALSVATETIFGQIFYIFNSAMLIVAGVILTYGTLKFIIELSQHHDQMQRKYNYWQPLRVVLGFGFLAPLPSGYSALNILIMWTFIQGIGLADSVWTQAVDYMNKGGILTIAAYQGTKSPIAEAPTLIAMEAIQHTKGSGQISGTTDILRSMVCMYSMQYALEDQRHKYNKDHGDNPDNTPVLLTPDFDQSSPTSTGTISFPGSFNDRTLLDYVNTGSKPLPDPKGNCGTYVWTNVPPLPSIGTGTPDKNGPTDYQNAKKVSAQQMVYELDGIAQLIAQTSDNTDVKEIVNPSILDQTDFQNEVMTTLVSTAADYQAYVYPFMVYANNGYSTTTNTPNSPVYEEIDTSKGWVNAGSYYFALIQLHDANAQKGAVGGTFTIVSIKGGIDTGSVTPPYYPLQGISDPLDQLVYPYFGGNSNRIANMKATLPWITDPEEPASLTLATNLNNANIGATTAVPLPEELKSLITGGQFNITLPAIQQNKTPLWGAWSSAMTTVANTMYNIASGVVLTPVNESINKVTKDWYNIFFNPSGNTKQSPFIGLQIFGNTLITESLNIWQTIFENLTMITTQYYFATTVIITATNAVTAVIDSLFGFGLGVQQLANQVQTAAGQFFHMFFEIPILIVMPIALAVCTIFLTMGITFSYYLPLVPFMLFLFGTLTWLMTVIEAMAAAPVIALAISAPEGGHDVLGKAEQAVGLIFSVFLRPVCLIMGLIAAIVLTYVALNVLNTTFGSIINSLFYANPQSNLYFQPSKPGEYSTSAIMEIGSAAMIIVYLMIVLALYNQCCTLIYTLVNKILQYVNIHPPTGAEEAMVREVKAGMEGYAKDMAGAGIQQGLGAAKPTFGTTAVGLKLPSVKEAVSEVGAAAAGAPPGATGGVGGK